MKKVILLSMAILLTGVAVGSANDRTGAVPRNQNGNPVESSDYLGVDYATTGLRTTDVLISSGESVFAGFIASSNTAISDLLTYFDSTSTVAGWNDSQSYEAFRVHLTSNSLFIEQGENQLGTHWKPPQPVRFRRGIVLRMSVGTLNIVTTFYNRLIGTGR